MRIWPNCGGVVALIAALACGKPATAPVSTLHVAVVPSSITAISGEMLRMSVTVTDVTGRVVTPDSVLWTSDDTTKVTISNLGVLRTIHPTASTIIRVTAFHLSTRGDAQVPVVVY